MMYEERAGERASGISDVSFSFSLPRVRVRLMEIPGGEEGGVYDGNDFIVSGLRAW
jgi:hypothetical protein